MESTPMPAIITISRQLGSGGASIGQKLARRLCLTFVDRQIIVEAAQKLAMLESEVESREERKLSFFENLLASMVNYPAGMVYVPPEMHVTSDKAIFETQTEIIKEISRQQPSVIIGRGSAHILKDHPRHLSVFFHASGPFRIDRVKEIYGMSEEKARATVEESDKHRAEYNKTVSGRDWLDIRRYHLCVDTGVLGFEQAQELVLACARHRLGIEP